MQKAISFEAKAIAQYIYQNNTSAKKERPQETSYFSFFWTELWMPYLPIILFFGPSVMLTTDSKKWRKVTHTAAVHLDVGVKLDTRIHKAFLLYFLWELFFRKDGHKIGRGMG